MIMKHFTIFLMTCAAMLVSSGITAQDKKSNYRMDRSRLNVGAYILKPYARTEQHIKDIADCGIDFMTCVDYDKKMLDLFNKYHIGAVVSGVVPG